MAVTNLNCYIFLHSLMPFSFNAYSSLLLPAFIHGVLFACLSFIRFLKERRLHDVFLALLLLALTARLSFWMLGFAGWYDSHNGFTTFMFYFPFNTLLLVGPCLYFYFLSLTNRYFKITLNHWPHLVAPALLLLLYAVKFLVDFVFYRPFPVTEFYQYGTHGPMAQLDKSDLVYFCAYASLLFYMWLILNRFGAYRNYLLQQFTPADVLQLAWLRRLLILCLGLIVLMFIFFVANYARNEPAYQFNWYPYFILGLVIYYVAINGYYNSPALFKFLQFEPAIVTKSDDLPNLAVWKNSLQKLMDNEQPYFDAELTLSQLAKKMQTQPQILSKVINDGFGLNFNDYINGLRVAAIIDQFKRQNHLRYSLMGIAYDCGFNSKTTFNRAFKKVTGHTPSAYIVLIEGSNHHLEP